MKKQILPLLLLPVLFFALFCPVCVSAAEPETSLTLYYEQEGQTFPDLQIEVYRVAEALPDGSYDLLEPFASYPINIYGITTQEQWNTVAQTLESYIVANQVAPDRTAKTDKNGTAYFYGPEMGLYYVRQVVAENETGTYIFNRFLVYVPTPYPDGTYDYSVEAKPKCTNFVPKNQYTVTKLWQDGGQGNRPAEITVDIYLDDVLKDTQVLNADNNWSYTWSVSGDVKGTWTVAERDVPEGYKVTVRENDGVFSIINTTPGDPENPPTGDTFNPLPWVLALCGSGVMLLILAIYIRRRG